MFCDLRWTAKVLKWKCIRGKSAEDATFCARGIHPRILFLDRVFRAANSLQKLVLRPIARS